jgi:hypothetical protein
MPEVRRGVFHSPEPNWQPRLSDHVKHYRRMLDAGTPALGGPFLSGADGVRMVSEPGLDGERLRAFAMADPGVQSGLLKTEVRQWMIGMHK